MKKYISMTALAALAAVMMLSCKPTEKNYQAAYETAVQKRQDATQGIEAKLEAIDGIHPQVVGGDTIFVGAGTVKQVEPAPSAENGDKIGVAVAMYKMVTNARRHAADLQKEFPGAFVATDGQEKFYVIVARCAGLPEAAKFIKEFERLHPDYTYIGLTGAPATTLLTN